MHSSALTHVCIPLNGCSRIRSNMPTPAPVAFLGAQAIRERERVRLEAAHYTVCNAHCIPRRRYGRAVFLQSETPRRPPACSCTGRGRARARFSFSSVSSGAAGRLSGWKGALKLVMRPLSATCCPHTSRSTTTPVQAPPSTSHHRQQQR